MVTTLVRDAVAGGLAGAVLGGLPSTCHAVATGGDPLAAAYAAGRLLLPHAEHRGALLGAAAVTHGALSLGWALPIAAIAPRRCAGALVVGAAAGLAIAALDLGLVGRRVAVIRDLDQRAQWADHVAYGVVVAVVCARRQAARPRTSAARARSS